MASEERKVIAGQQEQMSSHYQFALVCGEVKTVISGGRLFMSKAPILNYLREYRGQSFL